MPEPMGNQTILGRVNGVAYDDSQLSREEAEAADTQAPEEPAVPEGEDLMQYRTVGVSPKTKAATIAAAVLSLVIVIVNGIASGEFDTTELGQAVTGLIATLGVFSAAYNADPGAVEPDAQA